VAYLRFDERGGWPPEGPPAPLGAPPPSPPPRCPAPPKLVERPGLLACPSPLSPRWDINPLSFRSPPPPRLLPLIQPNRKSPGNPPTHETNKKNGKQTGTARGAAGRRGRRGTARTWGPRRAAAPRVCGRVQWRRRGGRTSCEMGLGWEGRGEKWERSERERRHVGN
jgi:hypothetical protein